jgi:hypothetical protein
MYVVKYSSEISSKDLLDGTPMQQVQHHNSINLNVCSRHILDKNTVIKTIVFSVCSKDRNKCFPLITLTSYGRIKYRGSFWLIYL